MLNDPRFLMRQTFCKYGDVKYPKRCNVNSKRIKCEDQKVNVFKDLPELIRNL